MFGEVVERELLADRVVVGGDEADPVVGVRSRCGRSLT
jgi:hypothetical protein